MTTTKKRTIYNEEFKAEALKLGKAIGMEKAAKKLSLHESQLYAWRKATQQNANVSDRESELAAENARLKRLLAEQAEELEIVKKVATYFAKNLK
ncbi:transposase [Xenorhabdus sp. VLS]|uniref:Transposase n=1 Tax=Xenorhabdus lircayensis TaxID=2763499 RepID=A0ABS0UBK5_9GAMM|nr:transposase [Xenorhabdus lircayensis]